MPRKSAADLKVIAIDGRQSRLRPPASLSEAERNLFASLVAANSPAHFKTSDLPLLCQYVQAAVLNDQAAAELRTSPVVNGKPSPWLAISEKTNRACIALSMRLRLSPQARAPNTPTRRQDAVSMYDKMKLTDEQE
jgi:hypothetical protein